MPKHGKNYRVALEKIGDVAVERSLEEAVQLVKSTAGTKFDSTLEIHVRTGCDPKHADQIVRANITLPHGTGKSKSIAVFAGDVEQKEAKAAGADIVGGEELVEKVLKGRVDFDIAIATPDMMKVLAKAAKVLGPKGLMPSPKSGTVTEKVGEAVEEFKKGKLEFKTDKQGIIHSVFGKASFSEKNILENARAMCKAIRDAKPSGVKGNYIKGVSLSSSMGPGVRVKVSEIMENS